MIDGHQRQVDTRHLAHLPRPEARRVHQSLGVDAAAVRVDAPAAARRLRRRRHLHVLQDRAARRACAFRDRLRQRVRVHVAVAGVVQTAM